ncbi:pectinesterase inhibitor domain-containing protein [Artemisia annua]|uniref:Pectinesterase inhibitor domain-containing protein n=1 Tax=Artemisia annua TaxID=35608 RepID=A0A2U1P7Y8_ARTAN|nr:pectinesterase inhibitor domain-containing protein [Artemisia annua]
MTSPSSYLLFIVFSFVFLPTHARNIVHGTCKLCSQQDPNVRYRFCTTSLEAASGSHHANIRGLGKISIHLTHENLTDTSSHIKKLMKNNVFKLNAFVKPRLDDCLELYSDSIIDIRSAMKNYKLKRYDEASLLISAVMDAATTCENGFKEKRKTISPLTKRNNVTFELAAIGLSLIRVIQSGIN